MEEYLVSYRLCGYLKSDRFRKSYYEVNALNCLFLRKASSKEIKRVPMNCSLSKSKSLW